MACECVNAGWCDRHKRLKSDRMVYLCQNNIEYFSSWERRRESSNLDSDVYSCVYNHWGPLHYYAVKRWNSWSPGEAFAWLLSWTNGVPGGCGCGESWRKEVAVMEPDYSSARAFFEWAWRIHDSVNARLQKTFRPTLAETYLIWNAPMEGSYVVAV